MFWRPFVLIALLLAACGSSGSSNDEPAPDAEQESRGAADYCESISDFFCDFYLRCGRMDVETHEECVANLLESCNSNFEGQYIALEGLGYLSLDANGLEACRAHLETVACEQQFFELTGPCAEIWQGQQSAGESCGLDVEFFVCDDESACVLGLDFCGTCRPLVGLGEACTPVEETCGDEAFCLEGICTARKRTGESCGPEDRCQLSSSCVDGTCVGPTVVERGDACDRERRCPYMTECVGGVCVTSVGLGQGCSASTPCAAGYCDGVCKEPQADGASCTSPGQCRSGLCVDGSCEARPSACLQ